MEPISRHDAEQIVMGVLQEEFPEVLDPTTAQVELIRDGILELDCGWVIPYSMTFADPEEVLIGDSCLFVDNVTGKVSAFSSILDPSIQGAVYTAIQRPGSHLPWPTLGTIQVQHVDHVVVNVAPFRTLCDYETPGLSSSRAFSAFKSMAPQTCVMCAASTALLGEWCTSCGQYLREDTSHECPS